MVSERTQEAPPLSSDPGQALPPSRREQATEAQLCCSKAEGGRLRVRPPLRSQETGPRSLLRLWETAKFCRLLVTGPTGRGPVGTSNLADPHTDLVGRDRQVAGRPVSP